MCSILDNKLIYIQFTVAAAASANKMLFFPFSGDGEKSSVWQERQNVAKFPKRKSITNHQLLSACC